MIQVREFLATKSGDLFSVGPDESIASALAILAQRRIGALLVLDGQRLVVSCPSATAPSRFACPG